MMNQEKLKGHLLILAANILFAINMPVSKYLLPRACATRGADQYADELRLRDVLDHLPIRSL